MSELFPRIEKKIFKSLYHLYVHALAQELLPKGLWNIILIDPPLVIITIHLFCLNHFPEYKRRFLKKYINFTLFTPKIHTLWLRGHGIYNFLSSLPLHMLHTKFGQDWPSSSWEDVNGRRTTHDDRHQQQSIPIGHLSEHTHVWDLLSSRKRCNSNRNHFLPSAPEFWFSLRLSQPQC